MRQKNIILEKIVYTALFSCMGYYGYIAIENLYLPPEPVKILLQKVQQSNDPKLTQKFGDLSKIHHKRNNFYRVLWDGTISQSRASVSCELISENGDYMLVFGNFLPTDLAGYDMFRKLSANVNDEQKEKPTVKNENKWKPVYISVQGKGDNDITILKEF